MLFIFTGLLAAISAYYVNRWAINLIGEKAIYKVVPLVEELLKTGLAVIFGASIFFTHAVFGALEAIYDVNTASSRGVSAAFVSFISHLIFGLIAQQAYLITGIFALAVALSAVLHFLWNIWIVSVVSKKI